MRTGQLVPFLLFAYLATSVETVSESQMKNAAKLVQGVCQRQSKVSKDLVEKAERGEFVDDPKLKCYLKCVMEKFMIMKNGRVDYKSALDKIKTLPEKHVETVSKVLEMCKDAGKSGDACEAAFETAKCMHQANKEAYVLP